MLVLGIATACAVAGLVSLALAPQPLLVALRALVTFVAATGMITSVDAWAGDLAGRAPGRFLPTYNSWTDLGAALGPVIGYSLVQRLGLPITYLIGAGLLAALWLVQALLVPRRRSVS